MFTYGIEYSSARTFVEKNLDLRATLRCLEVHARKISYILGYDDKEVSSSVTPHRKTHKRHAASSFHCVREVTSAKIIACNFINGTINPADFLSKHLAHHRA